MNAEEILLDRLRSALAAEIPARDLERILLRRGPARRRSTVYFAGLEGPAAAHRWVIKWPHVDNHQADLAAPLSAAAQFRSLQRLREHLHSRGYNVTVPRPVALMEDVGAYVMEYVDGPSVKDRVEPRSLMRPTLLLGAVSAAAEALRAVHTVEPAKDELVDLADLRDRAYSEAAAFLASSDLGVRERWFSRASTPSGAEYTSRVVLHGDFIPENVLLMPTRCCCLDADLSRTGAAEHDVVRFLALLFEARLFVVGHRVPAVQRLRRRTAATFLHAYYADEPWPRSLRPLMLAALASRYATRQQNLMESAPRLRRLRRAMVRRHFTALLDEVSEPDWP